MKGQIDHLSINDSSDNSEHVIDEIKTYLDCRYISPCEAAWRIFEFPIHHREPVVEKLVIHLENMNQVLFQPSDNLSCIAENSNFARTMFTEWMQANYMYKDARCLTYSEFPTKWVWHNQDKLWTRRKKGHCIGRIAYVHPSSGELYYLRMLLNIIKGPKSYEDIKTVSGILHPTFQSACDAHGLLSNDTEWIYALEESIFHATSSQLRNLFTVLIIFCEVNDPRKLFETFWKYFTDDIRHELQNAFNFSNESILNDYLKNKILLELENFFNKNNSSLSNFDLPQPNYPLSYDINNRLLLEELNYDINNLREKHSKLLHSLNSEQRIIYDDVVHAVIHRTGGQFFVYGYGGTGKTYLYETIISFLRANGMIVLVVASSGIVSLLLSGGRTAHSRFKIPLDVNEHSTCEIKKGTQLARLIEEAKLIIWDEAPMAHMYCFEVVDRTLRDILFVSNINGETRPFGGKPILLDDNF